MYKRVTSIALFYGGFKSSCWLNSPPYVTSLWCNVEYLLPIIQQLLVLFISLQNILILSVIIIVLAGVKSTNVICPRNETYPLCIFAIFSKTGFVDIAPLCCKPSISKLVTIILLALFCCLSCVKSLLFTNVMYRTLYVVFVYRICLYALF